MPIGLGHSETDKATKFGAVSDYVVAGYVPTAADFVAEAYFDAGVADTFAGLLTFTRASSATYVDASGVLQTATTDTPRFTYDPLTGEKLGLMREPAATNLLLNSGTLSTQSVTVSAVAYTLHFTGTGTVTLSGASTAGPLVGTGTGEANRVSLTFTPSAGSLTLTVSGTVTNAQLETGNFPSSYIATAGATATRAAETIQIPAANLPTPPSGGAWVVQMDGVMTYADIDTNATVRFWIRFNPTGPQYFLADVDTQSSFFGLFQIESGGPSGQRGLQEPGVFTPGTNVPFNIAALYFADRMQAAYDGNLLTGVTHSNGIPTFTTEPLQIMPNGNAIIKKIRIFTDYVSDSVLAEMTT